jgi:hypothetical protein
MEQNITPITRTDFAPGYLEWPLIVLGAFAAAALSSVFELWQRDHKIEPSTAADGFGLMSIHYDQPEALQPRPSDTAFGDPPTVADRGKVHDCAPLSIAQQAIFE